MPGLHITQQQETLYMKNRQLGHTQEIAAAKAGISERSGRRLEMQPKRTKSDRHWRTRTDPFENVWEAECVPLLTAEPDLTGTTLWEYLDERWPGCYPESQIRTLQRRVKHWRAIQGPDKPVIFRQSLPPGLQGLSDFTHPRTAITIAGQPFDHLLYQFRLAFSGWRDVSIIRGGESYSALAEGLQNALHQLGGSPLEHRSDSLSAAYVNQTEKQHLTERYQALCQHYRMRPSVNNRGISHENGAIETAHGSLKHRLEQAFKLRGHTDFDTVDAYRQFLKRIVAHMNRRCQNRLKTEYAQLHPLPSHRFMEFSELSVKVTTSSTITVHRVLYTVPSRLIGETLRIHLYHDRLEGFVGQTLAVNLPRVYPKSPQERVRRIDYRHVIHALAAKPQAFRFSSLREDLLPTPDYQTLWQRADQQFEPRQACKWIVSVLRFACDYDCEQRLAEDLLQQPTLPELKDLQQRFIPREQTPPVVVSTPHSLASYEDLLTGEWQTSEATHV